MTTKTCARCSHFRFRDDKGSVYPQIEHGIGRCDGFDGHVAPMVPFVRWDSQPCILFDVAKDAGTRMEWIDKQIAKEKK